MMLRVLFLCFAIALPAVAAPLPIPDQGPALRIQGSNTIGANLGPALVSAMLAEQGLHDIHSVPVIPPNEHTIVGTTAQGRQIRVDVAAHGSGTGFTALAAGHAVKP